MRRCQEHEFITYVEKDANFYNFPIHKDDIPRMPDRDKIEQELKEVAGAANARNLEEYWIGSVGESLYNKIVNGYTKKMWDLDSCTELDDFAWSPKGVAIKEGSRACWDEAISAYPIALNGYDEYFDIATEETTVLLNRLITEYDPENKRVFFDNEWHSFDLIVSTVSPDVILGDIHGELPFLGRDFFKIVLPVEYAFPENVYFVYYGGDEPFTRAVEYKKFTNHKSPHTFIGLEIPSDRNKLYPMPIKREIAHAQQYFSDMPEGIISMGRAGSYKYIDIDDIIDQAMAMAQQINEGGLDHPVPLFGEEIEAVAAEMNKN